MPRVLGRHWWVAGFICFGAISQFRGIQILGNPSVDFHHSWGELVLVKCECHLERTPKGNKFKSSLHTSRKRFFVAHSCKRTDLIGPCSSKFKRLQMWRSLNKSWKMCESVFHVHDLEQDKNNGMGYTTGPQKTEKKLMIRVTPVLWLQRKVTCYQLNHTQSCFISSLLSYLTPGMSNNSTPHTSYLSFFLHIYPFGLNLSPHKNA